MDHRFAEIICEIEGILSPEATRREHLRSLIMEHLHEFRTDDYSQDIVDELAGELYNEIYGKGFPDEEL